MKEISSSKNRTGYKRRKHKANNSEIDKGLNIRGMRASRSI
jgi:hypothetical protein